MTSVRMALCQMNSTVGDLPGNQRKIIAFAEQARLCGADLVVFPELCLCGYPPEDLLLKPYFLRKNAEALERLAGRVASPTMILGLPSQGNGQNYNSAAVLSEGRVRAAYNKMRLPNYGVFDEKRYFEPGTELLCLEHNSVLFGVTICEDIWDADGPCRDYAENGVQVIINVSASPYHRGKMSQREEVVRQRAKENRVHVFYCNLVGGQDELVFDGGSFVVSGEGHIVARAKQFEEDLVLYDLVIAPGGAKPTCPVVRISSPAPEAQKPPLPSPETHKLSRIQEVYAALLLGLKDYVRKNGFSRVILGLSGGIDSALTACIAVDALGADKVEALTMPSVFSSERTQRDAHLLARNLGIKLYQIPISAIYRTYLEELQPAFEGLQADVAEENIQARIRGTILMAFSNKFGHLVLTTGNKSETSVGYCTLYGDTAGGFAVLKDVCKTLVYELALFVNQKAAKDLIPETIIERPPTAELKPDQKDEDVLPPYDLLDVVLEAYVEEDKSADQIISEGFDPNLVHRIIEMVDRNEYKRRQAPPGIKITPKAFGRDRRMPITSGFRFGWRSRQRTTV